MYTICTTYDEYINSNENFLNLKLMKFSFENTQNGYPFKKVNLLEKGIVTRILWKSLLFSHSCKNIDKIKIYVKLAVCIP